MSRIADKVGFVHLRVHSAYSLLEGALQIKKLAALAKADRMPALGPGRHRQPVRRPRVRREDGRKRHPADRRLPGRDRLRRHAGQRPTGRPAAQSLQRRRPHRCERGGLLEPGSPGLFDLHGHRPGRADASRGGSAGWGLQRADPAHRRSRGADRPRHRDGAGRPRRRAARPARCRSSPTGSMSNCSATAPRARRRSSRISSISPMPADCRWWRPTRSFFPARDDYEAHDALICIAEGAVIADDNRRRLTAGALFQDRARR